MTDMNIPKWIADIYYQVDKNRDGSISKKELNNLDRQKEGIGTAYQFEAGMNLNSFVNKNRSIFSGYVNFEGDPTQGRQILDLKTNELAPTESSRNESLDSPKSIEVGQGEYTVAKYSEDTPYLQTFGIGPCVAVTIYDKEQKMGFLTHIDTPDKAKSLNGILNRLSNQGFNLENCEVRIIGGQTGSSTSIETIKTIQQCFENTPATIAEMDVLGPKVRSIQLDLNTGEVTDYQETIHIRKDAEFVGIQTLINNTLIEHKPNSQHTD